MCVAIRGTVTGGFGTPCSCVSTSTRPPCTDETVLELGVQNGATENVTVVDPKVSVMVPICAPWFSVTDELDPMQAGVVMKENGGCLRSHSQSVLAMSTTCA